VGEVGRDRVVAVGLDGIDVGVPEIPEAGIRVRVGPGTGGPAVVLDEATPVALPGRWCPSSDSAHLFGTHGLGIHGTRVQVPPPDQRLGAISKREHSIERRASRRLQAGQLSLDGYLAVQRETVIRHRRNMLKPSGCASYPETVPGPAPTLRLSMTPKVAPETAATRPRGRRPDLGVERGPGGGAGGL
jgi:hypothetical protein